jgi:hypothetical protein
LSIRTWVYGKLTEEVPLVEGRVFAKKTMTSSVEDTPYIVYKLGNSSPEQLSETIDPDWQYFQVWVHDYEDPDTADYMRIDAVLAQVRAAFRNASSAEEGIIQTVYLETSQDLNDETLNTVMKYSRFQLVKEQDV